MNNSFNFNRFWLLVKRQWLEFGKIYLISLLVITGAIIAFYFYGLPEPDLYTTNLSSVYQHNNDGYVRLNFRLPLFLTLGFIFISIIASGYFSLLGQKPKAIIELMTPASTLEKWLCGVFYTSILSVFSFFAIFYLTDMIFVNYLQKIVGQISYTITSGMGSAPKTVVLSVKPFFIDFFDHKEMQSLVLFPFVITSVFLLGSAYFNRFHYIKTAVVVMLFCTALIYTMIKVAGWLTFNKVQDSANFGFRSHNGEMFGYVLIGTALITLFFWTVTFFRVKEKEV
jgi:hypothetical protein